MSTYNKNFLTKVGFRIDFNLVELGKLESFVDKIKSDFPIMETEAGEEGMIDIDLVKKEVKQNITPITSWNFYNTGKTKRIKVHPKYFVIEYNSYTNSSELLADIKAASLFINDFNIKVIDRVNLQYINEIKIADSNPLDWESYINNNLLGSIKFIKDGERKTARVMGNIVIKEDFGDINFNYGLWNSNYPNEVNEKVFILDFNGYSKFPIDVESLNLQNLVTQYNNKIEGLFESVIEQGLREILNS